MNDRLEVLIDRGDIFRVYLEGNATGNGWYFLDYKCRNVGPFSTSDEAYVNFRREHRPHWLKYLLAASSLVLGAWWIGFLYIGHECGVLKGGSENHRPLGEIRENSDQQ